MTLCRAPNVFRCAVAGAPVTSWDGYDTHYTGHNYSYTEKIYCND
jgi:dipeptidyl aminopeptidase/acylaminoacyl peptidase